MCSQVCARGRGDRGKRDREGEEGRKSVCVCSDYVSISACMTQSI